MRCRRRPTLPRSRERSTIGAVGLNDRVRNGNECGPYALVASVFGVRCSHFGVRLSDCSSLSPRGERERVVLEKTTNRFGRIAGFKNPILMNHDVGRLDIL